MTVLDIVIIVAACVFGLSIYSIILAVLISYVDKARTDHAIEYETKVGAFDATLRAMSKTYTTGVDVHGKN